LIKYGGDEYVIIFPGRSKTEAAKHCKNILRSIRESTYLGSEAEPARITTSFGIVNYSFRVWVRKNKHYLILNRQET
jgi:GGDEF domain-containing protein